MFCNTTKTTKTTKSDKVAILVLVDSVLQLKVKNQVLEFIKVAILVLVDSVLQYKIHLIEKNYGICRNPCFSGQCFAINIVEHKGDEVNVSQSLF